MAAATPFIGAHPSLPVPEAGTSACSQGPQIKDEKSVQGAARVISAWHLKWRGKKLPLPVTTPNAISAAMLVSSECSRRRQEIETMSFFRCSNCGCVEDTALCNYWVARIRDTPTVCSGCDCNIGKWHGQFPRESAENWITDERGFLFR